MDNTTKQRRSSIKIMGKMIGLVKPLVHIMTAAVLLGTLGYLCAIFPDDHSRTWCTSCYERAACDEISDQFGCFCSDAWNPPLCRTVCNHFIAFKLLVDHQTSGICGTSEALPS